MVKGAYIAMGFVPTIIALYILLKIIALIDTEYPVHYFVFISVSMCLATGIILIKKGYKNIGTGVIAALISFYLFFLMLCWMMSGPM
jgi:hypothetical protein